MTPMATLQGSVKKSPDRVIARFLNSSVNQDVKCHKKSPRDAS
jgi:hypothetical protein